MDRRNSGPALPPPASGLSSGSIKPTGQNQSRRGSNSPNFRHPGGCSSHCACAFFLSSMAVKWDSLVSTVHPSEVSKEWNGFA